MTNPLLPQAVEILSWEEESEHVFTIETNAPPGYGGFQAGQFNMLYVPGAGESAISISGDPGDPGILTHTVRAVGNVTGALRDLRPPQSIGLRGPYGQPWPLAEARGRELLLLAGGIGLAPLRPVLYAALAVAAQFKSISLLLGARSPAELLYAEQLQRWRSNERVRVLASVDTASQEWHGDVGVITDLISRAEFDPAQVVAMICGPEIMLRFCAKRLRELGVAPEAIYVSLERNMQCAAGFCGHCQLGPYFVCKDGPVFAYADVERYLMTREF